jgi:hypothetical protein
VRQWLCFACLLVVSLVRGESCACARVREVACVCVRALRVRFCGLACACGLSVRVHVASWLGGLWCEGALFVAF